MYFRLNPECYFVKGGKRGAIYDLIEGDIYSLEPEETEFIERAERNYAVDGNELFKKMESLNIGHFYEKPVYMERLRVGSPIEEYQPGHPPQLNRAFLEINDSCSKDCSFCGTMHRSLGCMGCNVWNEERHLSTERWIDIVDQLADLGCRELFVSGGDLTQEWERTLMILYHAKARMNVYVKLHKDFFQRVRKDIEGRATPIIQLDISDKPPETGGILLFTAETIPAALPEKSMIDYTGRDFSSKRKIPKTNLYQFFHNTKLHPCLGGSLTISVSGNVLPCPMMRKVIGNVEKEELYDLFGEKKEEIEKYWNLTLDGVEKCKACELRYACTECRALEGELTGDIYGKKLCNYDPEKGTWAD